MRIVPITGLPNAIITDHHRSFHHHKRAGKTGRQKRAGIAQTPARFPTVMQGIAQEVAQALNSRRGRHI